MINYVFGYNELRLERICFSAPGNSLKRGSTLYAYAYVYVYVYV